MKEPRDPNLNNFLLGIVTEQTVRDAYEDPKRRTQLLKEFRLEEKTIAILDNDPPMDQAAVQKLIVNQQSTGGILDARRLLEFAIEHGAQLQKSAKKKQGGQKNTAKQKADGAKKKGPKKK